MKSSIKFLENILLFGHSNPQDDIILLSAHGHITLTMISLQVGNSSSTLCNRIFGSLVGRTSYYTGTLSPYVNEANTKHETYCSMKQTKESDSG